MQSSTTTPIPTSTSSQSQLAAALLGNSTPTSVSNSGVTATSTGSTAIGSVTQTVITDEIIDDKDDVCEEENDDIIMEEDIIDEENDENESRSLNKSSSTPGGPAAVSRTITLQMLLEAGILQPGNGTMSIEYLGQRFIGDLLIDGKIKSQETDLVFASPSAWAIHCKRIINPEKKSGCGWASVKYKGRKLDAYKNTWFKRKQQEEMDREEDLVDAEMEAEMERIEAKLLATPAPLHRVVMKHNTVPNRAFTHDANTLIECVPFSTLGKIQPFLISITTNACLLMDFHCHLTMNEVSGYLAGHWDVNSHNLSITHVFPCLVLNKNNNIILHQIEKEIQDQVEQKKLTVVGWYHSHPVSSATPTYKDIDVQLEFQIKMKGNCDSTYIPAVGCIVSPYNNANNNITDTNSDTITNNFESNIINYWVIPPPEQKPNEYGRPMLMSYQIIQDTILTPPIMEQMKQCADFYKTDPRRVDFNKVYIEQNNIKYLDKLKISLINKLPRGGEQSETIIWGFICELLGIYFNPNEQPHPVLSIPKITQQQSNLMITSSATTPSTEHLVSVLGNKFTTQALLGLPLPPLSTSTTTPSTLSSTDLSIKSLTSSTLPPTFLTPTLYNKIIQQHDAINLLSSTTSIKIPQTDITLIKSSTDNNKLIDLIEFNNLINNKNLLNKKVIDFTNANDLSISSHQVSGGGGGGTNDELMKLQSQSSSLSVTPAIITTTSTTTTQSNDNDNKNQQAQQIINLEQQK